MLDPVAPLELKGKSEAVRAFLLRSVDEVRRRAARTPFVGRARQLETPLFGGETPWALRRLLECLATERPVVAMIEDVHLASEALMDLLDDVADRVRGPVLLLCSARPELLELRPSWGGGKARSLTISLGPLSDPDAEGLASFLLADGSNERVRRLTAAAEGNPFYLEQLAASLAEGDPSGDLAPPSVQALLAARLDRLEPAQSRVLALASIEGRRFRPVLVEALDPELGAGPLADSLEVLERRGLLAPPGAGTPAPTCTWVPSRYRSWRLILCASWTRATRCFGSAGSRSRRTRPSSGEISTDPTASTGRGARSAKHSGSNGRPGARPGGRP